MTKSASGRRSAPRAGKAALYIPDEGDLIRVDFSPTVGTEQAGPRYALVLSNLPYNARVGRCHACPTTGKAKGYPYEVVLPPGLTVHGAVLCDQGKPIDWRARGVSFMGKAPRHVVDDVRAKIKAWLAIP